MTKADLARVVYERHGGISNKEASTLVDLILDFIKQGLTDGDRVQISGFGTFLVREKKQRKGRNPQTGEEMTIQSRKSVVFRPSKTFQNGF
jgi:integration host factor subunit alpha